MNIRLDRVQVGIRRLGPYCSKVRAQTATYVKNSRNMNVAREIAQDVAAVIQFSLHKGGGLQHMNKRATTPSISRKAGCFGANSPRRWREAEYYDLRAFG